MSLELHLSRDFHNSRLAILKHNPKVGKRLDKIMEALVRDPVVGVKIEYLKGARKYAPFKIKIGDHWRILGNEVENKRILLDVVTREEANRRYKEMTSRRYKPPAT